MRFHLVLAGVLALAACGGDSSNAPRDPTYPAVSGTYSISGSFDDFTVQQAHFAGTASFAQASRESPALTGSINVTMTIDGDVILISGPLDAASVTSAGVLTFAAAGGGASWTFSGTMASTAASGRHTLTDGTSVFSGNWSMQRTGNLQALRATPGASADIGLVLKALVRGISR
jgi:hypothetical protein